jgi:hypothetical protein
MTWEAKAKEIIADVCKASYRAENPPNRKRHKAYCVPPIAMALIDALNKNDEEEAKRLFIVYRTGALSLI